MIPPFLQVQKEQFLLTWCYNRRKVVVFRHVKMEAPKMTEIISIRNLQTAVRDRTPIPMHYITNARMHLSQIREKVGGIIYSNTLSLSSNRISSHANSPLLTRIVWTMIIEVTYLLSRGFRQGGSTIVKQLQQAMADVLIAVGTFLLLSIEL